MTTYGLSQTTPSNLSVSNVPIWEVRTTAVNKTKILEFGFMSFIVVTVSSYGIGRSSSVGVNPTLTHSFVNEQSSNSPTAQTIGATAWGTAPGIPTNFVRRTTAGSGNAGGSIFTFPRGLGIPPSSSVVFWSIGLTSNLSVYAVIDE